MKAVLQIILIIGIIVALAFVFEMQMREDEFPGIDHSSEYFYCVNEGSIYLEQSRLGLYLYVSQHGITHSRIFDFTEHYKIEPGRKWLSNSSYKNSDPEQFLLLTKIKKRIKKLRNNPELRTYVEKPTTRIRIPAFKDPYSWRPKENAVSFREYYEEMKKNNFKSVLFHKIQYQYTLDKLEILVDNLIEYYNQTVGQITESSASSN